MSKFRTEDLLAQLVEQNATIIEQNKKQILQTEQLLVINSASLGVDFGTVSDGDDEVLEVLNGTLKVALKQAEDELG